MVDLDVCVMHIDEGAHILHTVLYYKNVKLFRNHCLSMAYFRHFTFIFFYLHPFSEWISKQIFDWVSTRMDSRKVFFSFNASFQWIMEHNQVEIGSMEYKTYIIYMKLLYH